MNSRIDSSKRTALAVTEGRPTRPSAWERSGAGAHSADESASDAPVEGGPNPEPTAKLFAGDTGALRLDTRRVIVLLLLGPALDARRQSKLWPVLMRDESVVRSRLHELFLDLVIDREQEVAFTRQIASAELELPVLLRRTPLTLLDSALLLFLRQRLTESDAQLERAVVSTQEMTEHLAMFQREATTDHARFGKQVQHAIDNAAKYSLLRKLRNSEDRFEVAPTLKLLFSAEEILALGKSYRSPGDARSDRVGGGVDDDDDARAKGDDPAEGESGDES